MKSITKFIFLFITLCIIPAMDYSMERQKSCFSKEQNVLFCKFIEQCTNNNKYTCPSCPDTYETSNKSAFRNHLLGIHIHPFSCNLCLQELRAPYICNAKQLNNCTENWGKHEIIPNINIEKNLQQLLNPSAYSRENSDSASNKNNRLLRPPIFSDEQNKLICRLIEKCKNNNNKYICPSPSCSKKPEKTLINSFRGHLLHFHIRPFSCSTCNQELKAKSRRKAKELTDCNINPGGKHTIVTNSTNIDIHIQQLLNQAEKSSTEQPEVEDFTQQNNNDTEMEIREDHINQAICDSLFGSNFIIGTTTDHAQGNNGNLSANTSTLNAPSVVTNNQLQEEPISESTSEKSFAEELQVEEYTGESSSSAQQNIYPILKTSITSSNNSVSSKKKYDNILNEIIKNCRYNNKYKCPLCTQPPYIAILYNFKKHLKAKHIHPYRCSTCNEELNAYCISNIQECKKCSINGEIHTPIPNVKKEENLQQLLNQVQNPIREKSVDKSTHQNKRPRTGESPFDQFISQDSSTTAMEISQYAQPTDNAQGNIENFSSNTTSSLPPTITTDITDNPQEPNRDKSINWEKLYSNDIFSLDTVIDTDNDFFNHNTSSEDNLLDF